MVLTAADEVSTEQRRGVVLAALAQRDAQVLPLNASTTSTQRALGTMSRENRRRGVGSASVRGLVPRTGSAPAGLVELEETARRQLRNGTKLAQHCRKLAGSVRDNGRRLAAADEEMTVLQARLNAYTRFFRFSVTDDDLLTAREECAASLADLKHSLGEVGAGPHPTCPCGNLYLDDSVFCRKCGAARPPPVHELAPRVESADELARRVGAWSGAGGRLDHSSLGSLGDSIVEGAPAPASASSKALLAVLQCGERLEAAASNALPDVLLAAEASGKVLLQCGHCSVFLLSADGRTLVCTVTGGDRPRYGAAEPGAAIEIDVSSATEHGRCLLESAPTRRDRRYADGGEPGAQLDVQRGTRTLDSLCVPLQGSEGVTLGVVEVINKAGGGGFDGEDEDLLRAFSTQVAAAVTTVRWPRGRRAAALARDSERRLKVCQRWMNAYLLALGSARGELAGAQAELADVRHELEAEVATRSSEGAQLRATLEAYGAVKYSLR